MLPITSECTCDLIDGEHDSNCDDRAVECYKCGQEDYAWAMWFDPEKGGKPLCSKCQYNESVYEDPDLEYEKWREEHGR